MARIFLLTGSNLGNRLTFLKTAQIELQKRVGKLIQASAIYETAAWGVTNQADFLNQVLELETNLLPEEILKINQEIEKEAGRNRKEKWGARELDIDILFYGDLVLNTSELTIPHPQLQNRRFTLLPLAEIAPGLVHPALKKTVAELLKSCPDELEAKVYNEEKNLKAGHPER